MRLDRLKELAGPDGRVLRITATPARHGPAGGDRGPVIGFVLSLANNPHDCLYISGDTVWYEGIEEVARRSRITAAVPSPFVSLSRVLIK